MTDDELRKALQAEMRAAEGAAPAFADSWIAATERSWLRRTRVASALAGVAAVAVAIAILGPGATPEPDPTWVDIDELTTSTGWVAPSDALLPDRRFDIFGSLPELPASTGSVEGALL